MRVVGGSVFDPATGIDLKAPTAETYADRISGGVTDVPRLVGQVVAGAAKGAMSNFLFGVWADEPAFQPRTKLEAAGKAAGGFAGSIVSLPTAAKGIASSGRSATRKLLSINNPRRYSKRYSQKAAKLKGIVPEGVPSHHVVSIAVSKQVINRWKNSAPWVEDFIHSVDNIIPWPSPSHGKNASDYNKELTGWLNDPTNFGKSFIEFWDFALGMSKKMGAKFP